MGETTIERTSLDEMLEKWVAERDARIAAAPICEPVGDQYIDDCPYSRTGFAIYNSDGMCTCRPAAKMGAR